jgi:DNA-binding XRE family transcriptional regulator
MCRKIRLARAVEVRTEQLSVNRLLDLEFALWLFEPGSDSLWVTLSSPLEIPTPGLGEASRLIRECVGLTQDEVSERSELHVTHISEIEQGRANPTHKTIQSLAAGLDVPASYIFALEDIFERRRSRSRRKP